MTLSTLFTHHHRSLSLLLILFIVLTFPVTYLLTSRKANPSQQISHPQVLAASTASFPSCTSLVYCKTWDQSCDGGVHYSKEQRCITPDGTITTPSVCPTDNSCLVSDTPQLISGPVDIKNLTVSYPSGSGPGAEADILAIGSGQSIGVYIFKSPDGNPPDKATAIADTTHYPVIGSYTSSAPLADNTFYEVAADNLQSGSPLTATIKLPEAAGTYYFVANAHFNPLAGWWTKTDRACPWYGKITTATAGSSSLTVSTTNCNFVDPKTIAIAADTSATTSASSAPASDYGSGAPNTDPLKFGYQPQIDPTVFVIPAALVILFILF